MNQTQSYLINSTCWFSGYTFSAKEKDEETGYSYFGARYYDSDVSVWLSVDPMSDKYSNISPFNYCLNRPVIYKDPDGNDPIVTITTEIVGYTVQKINGSEKINNGTPLSIQIPLYRAVVIDDEDPNFKFEFMVSRDSWTVGEKQKDGNYKIFNSAFEPQSGNNQYIAKYAKAFPANNDTPGYSLTQNSSYKLNSKPRKNTDGNNVTFGTGIMIHIGGYYFNESSGKKQLAGSKGCFTICLPGNNPNNKSDEYSKAVIGNIRDQSDKDSSFGYSDVHVIIQERANVETTKIICDPNK